MDFSFNVSVCFNTAWRVHGMEYRSASSLRQDVSSMITSAVDAVWNGLVDVYGPAFNIVSDSVNEMRGLYAQAMMKQQLQRLISLPKLSRDVSELVEKSLK